MDSAIALPVGGFTSVSASAPSINDRGDVLFAAENGTGKGIFVHSGTTDTPVMRAGDVAPGTGGLTYNAFPGDDFFGELSLNNAGDALFLAEYGDGSGQGLFVDSGGTNFAVALQGETAPDTAGGSYSGFGAASFNDSGDVAFEADVSGGSVSEGIFLDSGGSDSALVLAGQPAPGTGAGTFSSFAGVSLNNHGEVAFHSTVVGGAVNQGLFLYSDGQVSPLVLPGAVAPGTGELPFQGFAAPALNDAGDVAFLGTYGLQCSSCSGVFLAQRITECGDGVDNDGDGVIDLADPGCAESLDPSEKDDTGTYPCDDGVDNEDEAVRDYLVDFRADGSGDPGCRDPSWPTEEPHCQDGINNDGATGTDFDGGESVLGVVNGDPNGADPNCFTSWKRTEAPSKGNCGLGAELALLLPPLMWVYWRRSARGR